MVALRYLSPILTLREKAMGTVPSWLLVVMAVNTLPFLWIGVSMSVRRAIDAGITAWAGLAFLVPIVNYIVMLVLSLLPSRQVDDAPVSLAARDIGREEGGSEVKSALIGLIALSPDRTRLEGSTFYEVDMFRRPTGLCGPTVCSMGSMVVCSRT